MRHARSSRLVEPTAASSAAVTEAAAIEVWTDGACRGNPGPGGWGALLRSGTHQRELYGGARETTNNRMELTAVIEALAAVKKPGRLVVHTDSQYVKLGINVWLAQWEKRGWKTAGGKPGKNLDLWKRPPEGPETPRARWRGGRRLDEGLPGRQTGLCGRGRRAARLRARRRGDHPQRAVRPVLPGYGARAAGQADVFRVLRQGHRLAAAGARSAPGQAQFAGRAVRALRRVQSPPHAARGAAGRRPAGPGLPGDDPPPGQPGDRP